MGVIPIDNQKQKRVNWNAVKAEYIGGGISQRKLAEKYGIPWSTLQKKAMHEGWTKERKRACDKAAEKVVQKTAALAASNATIAADLKKRLLLRLQRIEAKYPVDATEVRMNDSGITQVFRIRDLTSAYKDLTEDIPKPEEDKNAPIREILKKLDIEADV